MYIGCAALKYAMLNIKNKMYVCFSFSAYPYQRKIDVEMEMMIIKNNSGKGFYYNEAFLGFLIFGGCPKNAVL